MSVARAGLLGVVLLSTACFCHAKPKTGRDWSKLSDKDWERIESEWETPEEKAEYEFKPPQQKGLDMEKLKKAKGKKLEVRARIPAQPNSR